MSIQPNKTCTKCRFSGTLNNFAYREDGVLNCTSNCNVCINKTTLKSRDKFNGFMKRLLFSAHETSKSRLSKGRVNAGMFNLNFEYLVALWSWQNGKCYYSGIQMTPKSCSNWQCSLERLDNNLGYIPKNVVFVCLEFNSRIQWTLEKINQVPLLDNQNYDMSILAEIDNALIRKTSHAKKKKVITNNIGRYICNGCDIYKNRTEFTLKLHQGCKVCRKLRHIQYNNTIGGHLHIMLAHAKSYSKKRNNVQNRTTDNTFDITFEDLVVILRNQLGRCAYSNIKLNYGSTLEKCWVASLERIDPTKGYVRDNICIICCEFNGPDHTAHIKHSNGGSGGWSTEKFKLFLSAIINKQLEFSNLFNPYMLKLINNPACLRKLSGNFQLEIIG